MQRFYIFIANILLITSLSAQNINDGIKKENMFSSDSVFSKNILKQPQIHISMGASYYSFNKNNVFSNWVSPEISYQISPKFNLKVGTLILNDNYNIRSFNSENNNPILNSNTTRTFIFLSGDYQLSKRIRFRGTTFQEIPDKGNMRSTFGYNQIGIDVKISDYMFISADFINISGSNNGNVFLKNPLYNSTMDFLMGGYHPNQW